MVFVTPPCALLSTKRPSVLTVTDIPTRTGGPMLIIALASPSASVLDDDTIGGADVVGSRRPANSGLHNRHDGLADLQ